MSRMPELDSLQALALRFRSPHSFSQISQETCYVSASSTFSALGTFIHARPVATHDCIAKSRTSTCLKRPAPLRFSSCNADELSPYTAGEFFREPCSTRNAWIPSTALLRSYSRHMIARVRDQLVTQHPAKSTTPPVPDLRSALPAHSASATAVSTKRPFGKRSSVIWRVVDRQRI